MSTITAPAEFEKAVATDRRRYHRYPLLLAGEYRLVNKSGPKERGFGKTLDISSGGCLFEANDSGPLQGEIELLLAWPALLGSVIK